MIYCDYHYDGNGNNENDMVMNCDDQDDNQ